MRRWIEKGLSLEDIAEGKGLALEQVQGIVAQGIMSMGIQVHGSLMRLL